MTDQHEKTADEIIFAMGMEAETRGVTLPKPHKAHSHDGETLLVEYITPHARMMFNVENDAEQSGWGVVRYSHVDDSLITAEWGSMKDFRPEAVMDLYLREGVTQ